MTKLGEALSDDFARLFKSAEYNDFLNDVVGKGYKDKIEEMNMQALEPDGETRIELSDEYAEYKSMELGLPSPEADLFFRGRRYKSFGYFADTARSEVSFDYSDSRVSEYMYEHETGKTGLPIRRQFPVESDHGTVTMASSADPSSANVENLADSMAGIVYKGMEQVLNAPRTVRIRIDL